MDEMTWHALHVAIGRTAGLSFDEAWNRAGEPPVSVDEVRRRIAAFCEAVDAPLKAAAGG